MVKSLLENPNFSWFTWNPTEWDEAADDTIDTLPVTGDITQAIGGGDNYGPLNPDPNTMRLPSSYRETPGLAEAGDQWLANQALAEMIDPTTGKKGIDNPWASEAGLRIPYDAPDLRHYSQFVQGVNYDTADPFLRKDLEAAYESQKSMYDTIPDYVSPGYEEEYDINLEPGKQHWFSALKSNLRNNPLMQGVLAVANPAMMAGKNILQGISSALPISERAIMENEALGSGIALDDIGRVVRQEYGKDPKTGEWGTLAYDTAENIMAGYNYAKIDEDTFDDRIDNLKMKEGKARDERIKAIKAAKQAWLLNKQKTDWIVQGKKLDRATDEQKTTIEDFKTKDIIQDDPSTHTFKTPPKDVIVPPKDDVIVPKRKPKAPSTPSYSHPSAGVGAQASIDTSGKFAGKGTGNPWGRAKGGLIRRPYGKGGIVDLL